MPAIILLATIFSALFAFIAWAPREVKQMALAWSWVAMAVGAVVSVGVAVMR